MVFCRRQKRLTAIESNNKLADFSPKAFSEGKRAQVDSMSILVFSEKNEIAFELLAKARTVFPDSELSAAVLASEPSEIANDYIAYGADIVYYACNAAFRDASLELYALVLRNLVETNGLETILMGSTKRGKQTAPLLAQMLSCGCVTDSIELRVEDGALQADRYALAGNTIATEVIHSKHRVIAVMPHAFKARDKEERNGVVKEIEMPLVSSRSRIIGKREKKGEHVELEAAKIIVGVGKGFANPEDLGLAHELASVLNAELGCTRPLAVDYKWLAEDRSIGLSSKKVAPELYIAIGISGQIQHTVGILRARTIVALNKSEDAPIFSASDYGIVGDLYKVLPRLTEELRKVLKR